MESPEVPLEQSQEEIAHHAHGATEPWILGVALTAAILAACAAVASLMAEDNANEAMIERIECADQWSFYQAKGIKANVLATKIELRQALGKTVDPEDVKKLKLYGWDQGAIAEKAKEYQAESEKHLTRHNALAPAVTMFQLAIAVGAVSVLTRRKAFWWVSIFFGAVGLCFLAASQPWMGPVLAPIEKFLKALGLFAVSQPWLNG